MSIRITALYRYPVKSLSPEALDLATLSPGEGIPGDRRFAIARGNTPFDPTRPEWLPKHSFIVLAQHPRLAALTTRWDEVTNTLVVERDGRQVARGSLATPVGRAVLAEFFAAYLKGEAGGTPRIVEAPGHMFSDTKGQMVSLASEASLRDLERVAGRTLDIRRFRPNIVVDGSPPWEESTWIGKEITIGEARLLVRAAISRCPATSADPDTGTVNVNVPRLLKSGFGHDTFGLYARVVAGGMVRVGDTLTVGETVPDGE